ncbi:hypothetical protein KUV46_04075 [Thalassovita mediterranea]|nr:hypothetical protein KUV46_04075 [Thalassovita mediterranea]
MSTDLSAEIQSVWGRTWQPLWGHMTLRLTNKGQRAIAPGTLAVKQRKKDGSVVGFSRFSDVELEPGEHTLVSFSSYPADKWLSLKYTVEDGSVHDLRWQTSIKVFFWRNAVIESETKL